MLLAGYCLLCVLSFVVCCVMFYDSCLLCVMRFGCLVFAVCVLFVGRCLLFVACW